MTEETTYNIEELLTEEVAQQWCDVMEDVRLFYIGAKSLPDYSHDLIPYSC